jgi:hypothetical protein
MPCMRIDCLWLCRYNKLVLPKLESQGWSTAGQQIRFLCDDLRKVDWSHADFVYANSVLQLTHPSLFVLNRLH